MTLTRRTVLYAGSVQGVGFRWTTLRALEGLPLTGYVRNLRDGRVELVLEGAVAVAEDAIQRIRAALGGHIQDETHEVAPPTGEFAEFGIRR